MSAHIIFKINFRIISKSIELLLLFKYSKNLCSIQKSIICHNIVFINFSEIYIKRI